MITQGKYAQVSRGRMSAEDKAEIERLATTMAKPSVGKIAAKVNRHPATVNWFMLTRGLIERKPGRAPHSYVRNGRTVHPYSEDHDAFIEARRSEGLSFKDVAARVTEKFGIPRNEHSVQVRLVQLAAAPDEDAST